MFFGNLFLKNILRKISGIFRDLINLFLGNVHRLLGSTNSIFENNFRQHYERNVV